MAKAVRISTHDADYDYLVEDGGSVHYEVGPDTLTRQGVTSSVAPAVKVYRDDVEIAYFVGGKWSAAEVTQA